MVTYSVICDSHQVPGSMVSSSIPVWWQAALLPPWLLLLCSVLDFLCRSQCSDMCQSVLKLCCTVVGTWISSVLDTTVGWLWREPCCSVLLEVEALYLVAKNWSTLISLLELEALCFAYWTLSKYSNCILKSKHPVIAYWTRSNCLLNCVKVL
jgi:hypothetical protein